jgi:hypothetical protein
MDDLPGWQQTRWGMTESEIIEAVGSERLRRIPREVGNNWYADLTIQNVEIGRFQFDITFQMANDTHRLQQVMIRHEAPADKEPTTEFRSTMQILSERFGSPTRLGTSDTWAWSFPTTTIYLDTFCLQDMASYVAIRFSPSNRRANSKDIAAF